MRLIIGAGSRILPGFKTHDVQPLEGVDFVCDFWDLGKYVKPNSCEEIHMTHFLEHFPVDQARTVLSAVKSMMAEGGRLYIEVPNFLWHAQQIVNNPRDRQIVEYAFGGQLNDWDFHYNGFTPEILREDIEATGLTVESLLPNSSIETWVVK